MTRDSHLLEVEIVNLPAEVGTHSHIEVTSRQLLIDLGIDQDLSILVKVLTTLSSNASTVIGWDSMLCKKRDQIA